MLKKYAIMSSFVFLLLSTIIFPVGAVNASYFNSKECKPGFVLINHNIFGDICVSEETAKQWESDNIAKVISSPMTSTSPQNTQTSSTIQQPQNATQLPPYPNEPDVNLDLESHTSNFWPPQVIKVTDGVYDAVGYGLANSVMVVGNDGIIIIDTMSTYESAKKVMTEFRKITDKPVKAIIYTHSHPDHVNGAGAFAEEGSKDLEIYAHSTLLNNYYHESGELGKMIATRGAYYYGIFLPQEGPDRFVNAGIGPYLEVGKTAFIPPTKTFDDKLDIEVSGVKMTLIHTPSETNDEIVIWIPEKQILQGAEVIYELAPNLYSIRGSSYRDVKNWMSSLDTMIDLNAEYLIPSHTMPVFGAQNVKGVLTAYHDGIQYIYDQTIRGINQGKTADELANSIDLPASLQNNPWLQERYGERSWHIRGIYSGNVGWFNGDAAFLNPVSDDRRAAKIVEGFGGTNMTNLAVRQAIDNGEYEWAAELATYVIKDSPDNQEAKLLKAQALRILGHRSHSSGARDWYITEALILEGKMKIDTSTLPLADPSQIDITPIRILLEQMPTRLDPQKAEGVNMIVTINMPDVDEQYYFHIRNDVAAFHEGVPDTAAVKINADSISLKQIFSGQKTVNDLVSSGNMTIEGDQDALKKFVSMFDPYVITNSSPD